jgi:thioesterase domain-containing protein
MPFAGTAAESRRMSGIASNAMGTALSLSAMIALWQRLLCLAPIGADDDFFELGGDSLLALNLFHEIDRATGRLLPITAIYDAATPAKLMALLDEARPAPFSPLVLLKPGAAAPPLFILHGLGGNVIELERLGRLLDSAHPVYAVQALGVDGGAAPLDSVEAMADYDLAAIRERQPSGPYFLAGYSFGGLVALEIARRLGAAGERVALLGLVDAYPHPARFAKWVRHLVRARVALHAFRTMPPREAMGFVLARLVHPGAASARSALMLSNVSAETVTPALRAVYDSAFGALTRYEPRPYRGAIVFFRPAVSIFPIAPARVWGRLVDAIAIEKVAGNHDGMVREEAASLAAALSRVLRDALGEKA